MSQYPSPQPPYPTPPAQYGGHYQQGPDPLAAAKRASVMMFFLGALMLLLGALGVIGVAGASSAELQGLIDQQQQAAKGAGQPMPITAEAMRTIAIVIYAGILLTGIGLIGFGIGVRHGSSGATIGGLILSSITLLVLLLIALAMVLAALIVPIALLYAAGMGVPAVLFVLLIVWLVQALRARSAVSPAAMMQQYQAQQHAWHQQQQMGGYPPAPYPPPGSYPPPPQQSTGYGYGGPQQQPQQPPQQPQSPPPPPSDPQA